MSTARDRLAETRPARLPRQRAHATGAPARMPPRTRACATAVGHADDDEPCLGSAARTRAQSASVASVSFEQLLNEPSVRWPESCRPAAGRAPTQRSVGSSTIAPATSRSSVSLCSASLVAGRVADRVGEPVVDAVEPGRVEVVEPRDRRPARASSRTRRGGCGPVWPAMSIRTSMPSLAIQLRHRRHRVRLSSRARRSARRAPASRPAADC